jgi:GGDEF domain-containing protein
MTDELSDLRARLDAAEAELERLKLTLEVVGTTDLETGVLNRSGIIEGLERGRKWMARRGDIYGMLVVRLPDISHRLVESRAHELAKHITATVGAGVRDVDSVGRIDAHTYAAVLADLKPGSIQIVADRVKDLIGRLVDFTPDAGGSFAIGAVEVLSTSHSTETVFDTAMRMTDRAGTNGVFVGQI